MFTHTYIRYNQQKPKNRKTYHTFSHTQMKEKGDGKGKVKSRNKDKESRGEGRLFNF